MNLLPKLALACALAASIYSCGTNKEYAPAEPADVYDHNGVLVRHDTTRQVIWLVMSADSTFEGAPIALDAMEKRGIKGSFFFTGRFLRDTANRAVIRRIIDGGHYVSGHSDGHLLYADWDKDKTVLVTPDSLINDMRRNIAALADMGVDTAALDWFMPPYEWIEKTQVPLLRDSLGLTVINPTPGIQIFRDYTTPDMPAYMTSDSILRQLYRFEREKGLDGAFLLVHLGTDSARHDKLYYHFAEMIDSLTALGYTFERP